jgi:hypothetical protein
VGGSSLNIQHTAISFFLLTHQHLIVLVLNSTFIGTDKEGSAV